MVDGSLSPEKAAEIWRRAAAAGPRASSVQWVVVVSGWLARSRSALGAMAALPAVAAAGLLAGGTAAAYRASYRSHLRKFTDVLERMLGSVAAHAKTGGSLAPRQAMPAADAATSQPPRPGVSIRFGGE